MAVSVYIFCAVNIILPLANLKSRSFFGWQKWQFSLDSVNDVRALIVTCFTNFKGDGYMKIM